MITQIIDWYSLTEKKPDPDENHDLRLTMSGRKDLILCLIAQKNGIVATVVWFNRAKVFGALGGGIVDSNSIDKWCYLPTHPEKSIMTDCNQQFKGGE